MTWIVFAVVAAAVAVTLSSLWWARRPAGAGGILIALCVVAMFGISKEAVWGVGEVRRGSGEWCLTYEYPDGSSVTECRPTESEAWAWADALDAELEKDHGPREQETAAGKAFGVLFYVSLGGALFAFAKAFVARRHGQQT